MGWKDIYGYRLLRIYTNCFSNPSYISITRCLSTSYTRKKIAFEDIASNDLIFFQNKDGKIIHVGIAMKEKKSLKIIHAAGKVRIDLLDEKGIYNEEMQTYSHQLHSIKRVIK